MWAETWTLDPTALASGRLSATVRLPISPFDFQRTIRADAVGGLVFDYALTNRGVVGAHFEFNNLDYAYSRPQLLLFDLAMVGALSVGIALEWSWRASLVSYLGPYTLEIYLWHILLLYEGAWSRA